MPKPSGPISRALTFAKDRPGLVLAAAVLFISVLVLNPLREFPLDDDWAYSLAAQHLVEDGRLIIPDFATPNLVAHALWGGLFAKIFSLNYASLRVSTLALAFLCLAGLELRPGRLGELLDSAQARQGRNPPIPKIRRDPTTDVSAQSRGRARRYSENAWPAWIETDQREARPRSLRP